MSDTRVWLSNAFPGGYGWLFPKGKVANLGIGVDKGYGVDLKDALDQFHTELCETGLIGDTIYSRTGGLIPVGGLRAQLAYQNILFAGDAAGLTHPITGAGIAPAVLSGSLAGEAAAQFLAGENNALADYAEEIRDCFADALQRACQRRLAMQASWRRASLDDAAGRQGWVAFPEYFAA